MALSNALSINVIKKDTLKPLLNEITALVADTIKNTFGPFGHSTLIQTMDAVYSTKDGWNVTRNLNISAEDGEFSPAINSMKKLIVDVAQSVVLNAGDGTTTVILAANELNRLVSEYTNKNGLDSRTVENFLNKCVKLINEELKRSATLIDESNLEEIIKKIALISTNWDEQMSNLITEIYVNTKNPIIKVEDSGNQNTYVEYTEGYDLTADLQLANHFMNNPDKGTCEVDDPIVLIFAAPLGKKHTRPLVSLGQVLPNPLVVMAPGFDIDFLQVIDNMYIEFQEAGSKLNVIPCKFYAGSDIDKECVADLATLLGTMVLSTQYDKMYEALNAMDDTMIKKNEFKAKRKAEEKPKVNPNAKVTAGTKKVKEDEEEAKLDAEFKAYIGAAAKELQGISGACKHISIGNKYVIASGFNRENKAEFQRRKDNLKNLLKQKYEQYNAESSMTESVRHMRIRLGKMECNMGTIKVGGYGMAHIKARKDAIDDATRACEVAYTGGYILDGGLAIARAASRVMETTKDNDDIDIWLGMFVKAFTNVCHIMYMNKYDNSEKCHEIIAKCLQDHTTYNLVTEEYRDDELITPVDVCTEVVSACLRLVLVNCTSNQFVYQSTQDLIRSMKEADDIADTIIDQKNAQEEEFDD